MYESLASSWRLRSCLYHSRDFRVWFLPQVGLALKPFLPQLQTTFTKALQDSNRGVRLKAADALGKLISIHVKVDPLFTELLNGIRVMEDPGVRYSAALEPCSKAMPEQVEGRGVGEPVVKA